MEGGESGFMVVEVLFSTYKKMLSIPFVFDLLVHTYSKMFDVAIDACKCLEGNEVSYSLLKIEGQVGYTAASPPCPDDSMQWKWLKAISTTVIYSNKVSRSLYLEVLQHWQRLLYRVQKGMDMNYSVYSDLEKVFHRFEKRSGLDFHNIKFKDSEGQVENSKSMMKEELFDKFGKDEYVKFAFNRIDEKIQEILTRTGTKFTGGIEKVEKQFGEYMSEILKSLTLDLHNLFDEFNVDVTPSVWLKWINNILFVLVLLEEYLSIAQEDDCPLDGADFVVFRLGAVVYDGKKWKMDSQCQCQKQII
ncbi:hypothetical protein GIB67_038464 [Kingdonia uniflora]|uniref:Uncharacterized protein n=1 Tax=Kingdonia uniflora TaxID=39325 RepID=A0A7J7NP24_9MAGN|nr:hypothetical protein GIB67_038464 [Kingdonia uniflora]